MNRIILSVTLILGLVLITVGQAPARYLSHPPLRSVAPTPKREKPEGPVYHVDARAGDDKNDGGEKKPWKTIGHAVEQLKAGDTLYLRGGVYYENVKIRLTGQKDRPITLASYPGEQAILDGGIAEFFDRHADAWEPFTEGAAGEYRSKRRYPNIRHVVGSFGDSMVGLHSYYHAKDIRATSEHAEQEADKSDVKPIYCGPGLWYNRETGHLLSRFVPTNLGGIDNYKGEGDPRKLPLVIAPFHSVPLTLDRAEHVRIRDLVIRGGGYNTVLIQQSSDIEFDHVTIWCGTYGLRAVGALRMRLTHCGLFGNAPPWLTQFEAGFNTYPGRTQRDITRLNTHSWLIADANREFDVYCYPFNDDWEIAHCEFGDAGADGLYLGGVSVRFHHNLVDNTRDDGIYLSPMYPRHYYLKGGAKLHLHQNYFSRALTVLAFGGSDDTRDTIYFYRNVVDLRAPIPVGRGTPQKKQVDFYGGKVSGDHGSPPWPSLFTYHNTFVVREPTRAADMDMSTGATVERPRRVFNNVFLHLGSLPPLAPLDSPHVQVDGNLYWQTLLGAQRARDFFTNYRASPAFVKSKRAYPPGFETNSKVTAPMFTRIASDPKTVNDYRPMKVSPLVDAGVAVPAAWPDPLREKDAGKPDIGALPLGSEPFQVGIQGRIVFK